LRFITQNHLVALSPSASLKISSAKGLVLLRDSSPAAQNDIPLKEEDAMDLGLTGRVAIVTGGSYGIGRAVAQSLMQEGAKVAICVRNAEQLEHTAKE